MTTFSAHAEQHKNSTTMIILGGYLDAHTAPELERTIGAQVRAGNVRLIVDFTDLEYISSAGLGVFMVFIERIRTQGGDIKLAAMKEKVFSVFDLLGFPILFNIYSTAEEAVTAFPAV